MYKPWDRIARVLVCFKGDSGAKALPDTSAQVASAEIAMNNYNDYMTTIRPFEEKYIADVTGDPTIREEKVAGQVNADIAQKVGTPAMNPNRGMAPGSVEDLATTNSAAQVKGQKVVAEQRAGSFQAVIDAGMGKATTAQQGMEGLAQQSVNSAIKNQAIDSAANDATMSSAASGVGMAAGLASNLYDGSKKK